MVVFVFPYLRHGWFLQDLFDLERGVCVKCNLDCHALVERIRPLKLESRRPYILEYAPQLADCKKMYDFVFIFIISDLVHWALTNRFFML